MTLQLKSERHEELENLLLSCQSSENRALSLKQLNEFLLKYPKQESLLIKKALDLAVSGLQGKESGEMMQGARLYETLFIIDQQIIEEADQSSNFLEDYIWTQVSRKEFLILDELILVVCHLVQENQGNRELSSFLARMVTFYDEILTENGVASLSEFRGNVRNSFSLEEYLVVSNVTLDDFDELRDGFIANLVEVVEALTGLEIENEFDFEEELVRKLIKLGRKLYRKKEFQLSLLSLFEEISFSKSLPVFVELYYQDDCLRATFSDLE